MKLQDINLSTNVLSIDSWQGREKEVIIFSAVRCNKGGSIGFLDKPNRINVALTRAQHGLIIVGNARTLKHDKNWGKMITMLEEGGSVVKEFAGAR